MKNIFTIKEHSSVLIKKPFYLCNQAVNAKKEKCRLQWKYVTCKNCLKKMVMKNERN